MSFYSWSKRLLSGSSRFNPSPAAKRIPSAVIREAVAADIEVCHKIYAENETEHIPKGYFPEFERDLASDSSLWLVIEELGLPVGVGGVSINSDDNTVAALTFGIVQPDKQGMGYGSALLLARIAALPAPDPLTRVFMSSVGRSAAFYKKFGFAFVDRLQVDDGDEFDFYYTRVKRPAWEATRVLMASGNVAFDPESVSVPNRTRRDCSAK